MTWIFVSLVLISPGILYVAYLFHKNRFQKLPVFGETVNLNGIKAGYKIPAFEFKNQYGKISSSDGWNNKIVVVDFFFTHCTAICPKMTSNLKKVQQAFNDDEILIRSFSVDPERDSVGQLRNYANQMGVNASNWELLTGDKKDIYKLARNEFMIVATDGDGGPNDFIHSEKLVLIDKQKRIRGYYDGTSKKEVDQLIVDIKKLKNED